MAYTIQREAITGLWDELWPLLERHKAEVAPYGDWVLAPDRALYERIEAAGNLRVFTVRDETKKRPIPGYTANCDNDECWVHPLIGYCILTVGKNPHYTGVTMAHQDVLFVVPEFRGSGAGRALLVAVEEAMRAEGVQCLAQRCKVRPDLNLGALFKRQGYVPMDEVWLKRLDTSAGSSVVEQAVPNRQDAGSNPAQPRTAGPEFAGIPVVPTTQTWHDHYEACRKISAPPPELFQPRQDARDFHPHDALRGD